GEQVRRPHPLHTPRPPTRALSRRLAVVAAAGGLRGLYLLRGLDLLPGLRGGGACVRLGQALARFMLPAVIGIHESFASSASMRSVLSGRCALANHRPTVEAWTPSSRAILLFDQPRGLSSSARSRRPGSTVT